MTRLVLVTEGTPMEGGGRIILPGAIRCVNRRLPVVHAFDFSDQNKILGVATDFQRDEETGDVCMEVNLREPFNDTIDLKTAEVGFTLSPIEGFSDGAITSGILRLVSLRPAEAEEAESVVAKEET